MEKSIFKQMGGTYMLSADGMYYPDLSIPEEEPAHYGKYGRMRKTFLREHRHGVYLKSLLAGKLTAYWNEIDDAAREQVDLLVRQMAEKQGVTESMKAENQMAWVGAMNQIKHSAEEIVLNELIYN